MDCEHGRARDGGIGRSSGASVLFEATAARRSAGERFHGRCGAKRRGNRGRAPRAGGRRGGCQQKRGPCCGGFRCSARATRRTHPSLGICRARSGATSASRRRGRVAEASCHAIAIKRALPTISALVQNSSQTECHPHPESGAYRCSRGRALKGVFGKSIRFRERGPGPNHSVSPFGLVFGLLPGCSILN